MKRVELLSFDFTKGDLQDRLESFDRACQIFFDIPGGNMIDDGTKIGIVVKGVGPGPVKDHRMLHCETCGGYQEFRQQLDTIVKARNANLMSNQPMDLDLFKKGGGGGGRYKGGGKGDDKGKGKGGKGSNYWEKDPKSYGPDFTCHTCGKTGHKSTVCWSKGKGKGKGGGKGQYQQSWDKNYQSPKNKSKCDLCGGANHSKSECRASDAKKNAYQQFKKNKGMHELGESGSV